MASDQYAPAVAVPGSLLDSADHPFEILDSARVLRDRADALRARADSGFPVTLSRGAIGATSTLVSPATKQDQVLAARRALTSLESAPEERFRRWVVRLRSALDEALQRHPELDTEGPSK